MYRNVEFRTISVNQNVLPLLENHSGSTEYGSFHQEDVLWIGRNVQGMFQNNHHSSAFAINQTDLCLTATFCHSFKLCAISQF